MNLDLYREDLRAPGLLLGKTMETKFDPGQMVAIDITAKVDKIVIENTYPKPVVLYYLEGIELPLIESQLMEPKKK